MEIVGGKIEGYDERKGGFNVFVPYANIDRLILRRYDTVEVGLPDGRKLSPEQRMKAHALLGEIAEWVGDLPEYIKRLMKMEFIVNRMQGLEKDMFSLADCDVTTAREFIAYLIDFMLEHEVPAKRPLIELCDDIQRYVYSCLKFKRCAVCGRKAELHHVDAIGMGNDRTEVFQLGMRVLPLCREHHTEAHTKGVKWLFEDMHLEPIELNAEIGKVYKLTKKNLGETA